MAVSSEAGLHNLRQRDAERILVKNLGQPPYVAVRASSISMTGGEMLLFPWLVRQALCIEPNAPYVIPLVSIPDLPTR